MSTQWTPRKDNKYLLRERFEDSVNIELVENERRSIHNQTASYIGETNLLVRRNRIVSGGNFFLNSF